MKHLLRIKDLNKDELATLVDLATEYRAQGNIKNPKPHTIDKKAVCFFAVPSSRTKSSWEVGTFNLGMFNSFNDGNSSQLGKKESLYDSAKVFSSYYDIVGWRCTSYQDILEFSTHSNIPVINLLCDKNHPTQCIADLLTIKTHFGKISGLKIVGFGPCNNNVTRSLIEGVLMLGANYVGIGPESDFPSSEEMNFYNQLASENNCNISFTTSQSDVKDADVVYQDVFVDLREPEEIWPLRLKQYQGYQFNSEYAKLAKPGYLYMHCLPAFNGSKTKIGTGVSANYSKGFPWVKNGEIEVTNDVFSSQNSVVFEEAQNRLFAMEAIIDFLLKANSSKS